MVLVAKNNRYSCERWNGFVGLNFSLGCKFVGEKLRNLYTNAHKIGIDRHPDRTKIFCTVKLI